MLDKPCFHILRLAVCIALHSDKEHIIGAVGLYVFIILKTVLDSLRDIISLIGHYDIAHFVVVKRIDK